jgi:hypothetical protein
MAQANQKRSTVMADQTRDVLRRLAESMLRAGSQQVTPASTPPDSGPPPAFPPKARDTKLPAGKQTK